VEKEDATIKSEQNKTRTELSDTGKTAPIDTRPQEKPVAITADSTGTKAQAGPPEEGEKERNKFLALNRFAFSLLVAPDLSTVGFSNPGGISTNAGVAVSYFITDKWSISTGVVRARKVYGAKPGDYKREWPGSYNLTKIEAVCAVLDVPLNIGFKILQKEKSSVTLNTGVSSYIMLNEEYEYYYAYYGKKKWTAPNQNRHLFSIYNISGSYARQLGNTLAVGVEPFVKVPLAGVGAGKVKLTSAGIFFSLSYRYPQ
jgi:hypothetical protein